MKKLATSILLTAAGAFAAKAAFAGESQGSFSIPVDSPWALAGLAAVIALIAYRLLRNRGK